MRFVSTMRNLGSVSLVFAILLPAAAGQQPGAAGNPPRTVPQRPQQMPAVRKEAVYDVANLNREQFRALPPTALVIYNGQTISKTNYMAQKIREWGAKLQALVKISVDPQSLQLEFDRKRAAELTARNVLVNKEFEKSQQSASRLTESPQYAVLTKEANDLRARYQGASPTDKEKIKQRAAEVYKQLVQMEDGSQPLAGYVPHNGYALGKTVDQSSPQLTPAGNGKKGSTSGGASAGSPGFSEVTGTSQSKDGNVIDQRAGSDKQPQIVPKGQQSGGAQAANPAGNAVQPDPSNAPKRKKQAAPPPQP
jgi:hypothetical protein